MSDLSAIQRELAGALHGTDGHAGVLPRLAGDAAVVEARLSIYRRNIAAALASALAAAYPVIRQVVGAEFFDALARAYQRHTPSTSGDLTEHGDAFAAFLAGFEPARALPYLGDLARLEWAVHRAHGAADARPFDGQTLAAVAPEDQAAIRFEWAAGTAIVDSTFPIARLWQIHQPEFDAEFGVDGSKPECALVAREGLRVAVSAIGAGDAAFVAAGLAGTALGACTALALAADPGFDLGRCLDRAISANSISGFSFAR